ncbi:MAG: class I SAM-dependent methyltransferase [Planctomycetota bacterium]|jgi:SAM-dependent methyltransferase
MNTLVEYYEKNRFIPTTFDIMTSERLDVHRMKRENLYVNKLSIPNLVWRNAKVLEVGCSSGENSLLYAQMGAKLTLVEPLQFSVDKLKSLFDHYDLRKRIENIYVNTIENVTLSEPYDIIVAEGFLYTLGHRGKILRRLFQSLANDGLLILSTLDAVGSFCESMKAVIAQLYCRKKKIEDIDEQVEAIRPFFQEDFEGIPHSRSFELWAKDGLLNPLMTNNPFYDFDEMVTDLSAYCLRFYSSWPSYKYADDLKWHKHAPDETQRLKQVVQSYHMRRPSFLLGQVLNQLDGAKFLLEYQNDDLIFQIKNILFAMKRQLHEGQAGSLLPAAQQAKEKITWGQSKQILAEVVDNLTMLKPQVYRSSDTLRQHWGVPYHYIVFSKPNMKD